MRTYRSESGLSSLEMAVVIAVFSVLAAVLLERLLYYEAYTERVYFDLTIRQMQNALRMRVANLMVEKRPVDYIKIAGENPMDWLEKKPAGYVDSTDYLAIQNLKDGEWLFDRSRHQVLYRPRLGREFDVLQDDQGLVRVGLYFRYTPAGSPNGLELRVEHPDHNG